MVFDWERVLMELAHLQAAPPDAVRQLQAQIRAGLQALAAALKDSNVPEPDWQPFTRNLLRPAPVAGADLGRAMAAYRQVSPVKGYGALLLQERLLVLIAVSASAETIPFWDEVLRSIPPRDRHAQERREFALSALSLLAVQGVEGAAAALNAALHNPKPEVRALAAPIVAATFVGTDRALPEDLARAIREMAQHDRAFGPRFQARMVGWETGLDIPLDNAGGAYALQVQVPGDKAFSRTIELRSSDTLEDLHLAIQDVLGWDNDHLYSFYMTGNVRDREYEIPGYPEDYDGPDYEIVQSWETEAEEGPIAVVALTAGRGAAADGAAADEADEDDDEDGTRTAGMFRLGDLGLALKHKFLYMFDYGDENLFEIQVVAVRPMAEPGAYPRTVAAKGEPPEQYPAWDDDDVFDDEDLGDDDLGVEEEEDGES